MGSEALAVGTVADRLAALWRGGARWQADTGAQPYEARLLAIDSSLARAELGWRPRWDIGTAFVRTIDWYRQSLAGNNDMGRVNSRADR